MKRGIEYYMSTEGQWKIVKHPLTWVFVVIISFIIATPLGMTARENDKIIERNKIILSAREDAYNRLEKLCNDELKAEREKNCPNDLNCWWGKHFDDALNAIAPALDNAARGYTMKLDRKKEMFENGAWKNKSKGTLTYYGEGIILTDGYGRKYRLSYRFVYDPGTKSVSEIQTRIN